MLSHRVSSLFVIVLILWAIFTCVSDPKLEQRQFGRFVTLLVVRLHGLYFKEKSERI